MRDLLTAMSLLAVHCLLWQPQTHIRPPTCHVATGSCTYLMPHTAFCPYAKPYEVSLLPCRYWQSTVCRGNLRPTSGSPPAMSPLAAVHIWCRTLCSAHMLNHVRPLYCHVATGSPLSGGNLSPTSGSPPAMSLLAAVHI